MSEQETSPLGETSPEVEAVDIEIARLAEILRSSNDSIIGKDLSGIITSWNEAAARLYGYRAGEAVGQHINLIVPPGLESEVEGFMAALQRGERISQHITQRRTKDGRTVDVSVTISPIRDGEGRIVGASSIARNITGQRETERKLRQQERQIRLLLDSTAEAIYGIDVEGRCTFANPSCVRILGYDDVRDFAGRNMHKLIHHSHPDGAPYPIAECKIFRAFRDGQRVHVDDEVLWRKDGSCFDAEYWSHPILEDDRITGSVVTFLDISARKRAVAEMRAEARRRDEFLAMLSHELRNPLGAVLSAVSMLESEKDSEPGDTARARRIIARQARHMARLLDDLLDVGRIVSGRIDLQRQLTDLRDAVTGAMDAVESGLETKSIHLECLLPPEPLMIDGDLARLQQIVVNLLSNAIRYSPEGTTIWLSAGEEAEQVVLRVRDEGVGFDDELRNRMFELFVQGQRTIDRPEGGLGIGLTLVRALVEGHEGVIEASSDGPGAGSEFVVSLPRPRHATGGLGMADDQTTRPMRALRLLLIEDQDDAREALRMLLETRGHRVEVADDGENGLRLIRTVRPDVALVDIGLPTMDGYQVARAVRSDPELAGVLLVALTGYGRESDLERACEAGFDRHLTKPAALADLELLLASVPTTTA